MLADIRFSYCTKIGNFKNNIIFTIRYNNFFYIVEVKIKNNLSEQLWDLKDDIFFGDFSLTIKELKDKGIYDCLCKKAPITLRNVKGKERMMLNKHNHQELKKIFQSLHLTELKTRNQIIAEMALDMKAQFTYAVTMLFVQSSNILRSSSNFEDVPINQPTKIGKIIYNVILHDIEYLMK